MAQLEYKNQPVYHTTLMNKNNFWTMNQQIINDYRKFYQKDIGTLMQEGYLPSVTKVKPDVVSQG